MDKETYFKGIESYKLLAKHEVGQNFLIDSSVAERIVDLLAIASGERVLEIGSGAGSLTYFLAESQGEVTAIDIDEGLIAKLQNDFGERVNVTYGNAVKWDYSPYEKIVGNLPYYITSLIIERALLVGTTAKKMVFMVQKEVADRLLSGPGTKDYGPLPLLIALSADAKKAFVVRAGSFSPAPHVDSAVMAFDMKKRDIALLSKTYKLACSLFLQRRKTLFNNLKAYLNDAEKARSALKEAGLEEMLRPEQVTPEGYLRLSAILFAS